MTTKHTPGPWSLRIELDEDSCMGKSIFTIHEQKEGDILGICTLNNYQKNDEVLEANARLIAAAPELLEACKAQHEAIDILFAMLIEIKQDFFPSKIGLPWEALLNGNQAIKKA